MFGFSGCGTKPVPAREYGALYLADSVTVVSRAAGGASYAAHFPVSRNGIRRDGILLVCPVTVQAPLHGIVGRVTLEGVATPVYNIGDGMLLEILLVEMGQRTSVYSRTFDPGRKADDRKWIPFKIPLDLPQGRDLRIELKLTAGIQGDLVADWLSVSGLRVVPKI